MSNQENYGVLTAIDESPEEDEFPPVAAEATEHPGDGQSGLPTVRSPIEIFERFIMHLGPSMVRSPSRWLHIRS